MLDYLLDAMNEISDEHIIEAVNYEAKAKKINLKKIIPVAACFVFVIVAVIAGTGLFEVAPPTTEPTLSVGSPTQAPVQNTTVASTQCPSQKPWEEMSYGERYREVLIQDVIYVYAFESVAPERIDENITDYKLENIKGEIYKIKGMTKDLYVAVKFSEDEKGEYFLYLRSDYEPETLGNLLDAIGLNNNVNFIGNSAIYQDKGYNYDGKGWSEDLIEIVYNIDAKGHKELSGLLWKNREALCVEIDNDQGSNPGNITVKFTLMGKSSATICIEEIGVFKPKTFLSVYLDSSVVYMHYHFEIENSALKDYIAFLEDEAEIIRAERYNVGTNVQLFPEQLTSTTTPTTQGTTLPPINENFSKVEKVLGTAETLSDIIDGFDIKKADYGISGDMTVDWFARLEEKDKDETIYSIAAATMQQLVEFMYEHKDIKAENRECQADIRLVFTVSFIGNSGSIIVGNDGYLYISCGAITKAFHVGEDAYRTFKENLIAAVWTTEAPVTFG
ncbi:MAG: hypothetical protein IJW86_06865 [Clostridia bacterium]|nr:hypothetical protein [Clostridia bacterium]